MAGVIFAWIMAGLLFALGWAMLAAGNTWPALLAFAVGVVTVWSANRLHFRVHSRPRKSTGVHRSPR